MTEAQLTAQRSKRRREETKQDRNANGKPDSERRSKYHDRQFIQDTKMDKQMEQAAVQEMNSR